jgi:beta-glucosidase
MITIGIFIIALVSPQAPDAAVEARVNETLTKMSLDQKIGLISGVKGFYERGYPEFGLPELTMSDGPAGVRNFGPTTAYPAPVSIAASFDPELAAEFGTAIGRDGRSRGVHIWLGPGVNISRIPQNGRNFEYLGEDPLLAGVMAANIVKGVQSQGVAATVKHYATNNHENDRMVDSSDVDERTLREIYLKPFEAAVRDGGAWAVMCAYNKLNGTYCSENRFLLTDVLKHDWGFKGVLMSDWGAVHSTIGPIQNGLDLEMPGGDFLTLEKVKPLVESGQVSVPEIDEMVRRLLRLTFAMGFDNRDQHDPSIPRDDPKNEAVSLKIAREGIVLLKNSHNLLPLEGNRTRTVLVVGPNAQPPVTGGGGSSYTTPAEAVSLLDAIKSEAGPDVKVAYLPLMEDVIDRAFEFGGYMLPDGSASGLKMQRWDNMTLSGAPAQTRNVRGVRIIQHTGDPRAPQVHFSARWTGTVTFKEGGAFMAVSRSDDGIRVFLDDNPVIDDWNDHSEKVDTAQIEIQKGHTYKLRIEFYQNEGDAVARFGFFPLEGTLNRDLPVDKIKAADAVIASIGFNPNSEGEGQDRPFKLPAEEELMMQRLVALNPHVIVVNNSGAGVDMSAWVDKIGALVQAWYPGGVGSRAVAEVLFGKTNPSGKLPATFPKTLKGTYYETAYPPVDHHVAYKEGLFVGYRWFDAHNVAPLFPFGYGLSYTTFRLGGFTVESNQAAGLARIVVRVRNTGKRRGAETIQVYVHSPSDRVVQPPKALKGFARVELDPGEAKEVAIPIKIKDLAYWDVNTHAWALENGKYDLFVGTSSRDLPLKGSLVIGAG